MAIHRDTATTGLLVIYKLCVVIACFVSFVLLMCLGGGVVVVGVGADVYYVFVYAGPSG